MKRKKVSIVLSGGSIKGAFQVGVLNALMQVIKYEDIEIIAGTSVGNINGAMLAQKNLGRLNEVWDEIKKPKDMMKKWVFGIPLISQIVGFFKGGLYSFSPMEKIINKEITNAILDTDIKFYSCSINMVNGDKIYGFNHALDVSSMKKFITASSSMAPAFKPIRYADMWLTDGGCKEPVPVKVVVDNIKKSKLIIIILTRPIKGFPSIINPKGNLYNVAARNVDFLFDEVFDNDIKLGLGTHWKNKKYLIIAPDKKVFKDSFDITEQNVEESRNDGYRIGTKELSFLKKWIGRK